MTIEIIREHHWPGILETEHTAYIDVEPETEKILKSKWEVTPDTCLVSLDDDLKVQAYVLAHAWHLRKPPALFKYMEDVPVGTETLYLHDLAVHKNVRGRGIGDLLATELIKRADAYGFQRITLVAVQGSEKFWERQGFTAVPEIVISSSYGEDAVFMRQTL